MKAYTDLNQSKKLAEILPLESADMYYFTIILDYPYSQGKTKTIAKIMDGSFSSNYDTPCWSLAALLKMLKDYQLFSNGLIVYIDNESYKIDSDNPVDACVEMILKLKEENQI